MTTHSVNPIGKVVSPYEERFGVPRQPGMTPGVISRIILNKDIEMDSIRELEKFSHIWVIFHFHQKGSKWKSLVAPPRLGGSRKVGVFASRSPMRPNQLGLSAVRLMGIEQREGQVELKVDSGDFLDGTPIFDIKPYIPYSDRIENANDGWLEREKELVDVTFSEEALGQLREITPAHMEDTMHLIKSTLALDPRPAHERHKELPKEAKWGVKLRGLDVTWCIEEDRFLVYRIQKS